MNKKKWLTLGIVGTALLLIPRRSSRQASSDTHIHADAHTNETIKTSDTIAAAQNKNTQKRE